MEAIENYYLSEIIDDKAEFRIEDVDFGEYNNKAIAVLNPTNNSLVLVEITEDEMCRIRIQKPGETDIKVINLKNSPEYHLQGAFINTKQELVYGGCSEYFIKCLAENQLEQQDDTPIHTDQYYK